MRSVLWFLLFFRAARASSEESTRSNEATSFSDLQSHVFALADAIYDKQKVCDSIVGEAIVKAIQKDVSSEFLVPDERYLQCKKNLDEKKREYIQTTLVGLNYYHKDFPMLLSNRKLVDMPVPADESLSTGKAPEYDIQQALCMTNELCLTLIRFQFSEDNKEDLNEQKKHIKRCLNFLTELKLKYIDMKKLEEAEVKKRGLSIVCIHGTRVLAAPERGASAAQTTPSSVAEEANAKAASINDGEDKLFTDNEILHEPDQQNNDVKELSYRFQVNSKDQEVSDQDDENEAPSSKPGDPEDNNSVASNETVAQKAGLSNINKDVVTSESPINESKLIENDMSFGYNVQEGTIKKSKPSEDAGHSEKEETSSVKSESKVMPETNTSTRTKVSGNIPGHKETVMSSKTGNEVTNKKTESTKMKKTPEDVKNMELVTYRYKIVSKNGEGKVVRFQVTGRMKKTESEVPASNDKGLPLAENDSKSDDGGESNSGPSPASTEVIDETRGGHPESLEENIILMEHDCKELLKLGENLLKSKMLSSLVKLEEHYDECIKRLDAMKKMYIEKHQLDVLSHNNIIPLTLPSGDARLILLPTQFLKTDEESQNPSNVTPGNAFELIESFHNNAKNRNPTETQREPFDDPAFMTNEEFLKGLQQKNAPNDTSTLSKVASMLHMSGGHNDNKVVE